MSRDRCEPGRNFFRNSQGGSASPKTMRRPLAEGANTRRQKPYTCQRVADNAFHLKNEDCIADADEVFHPRGVPVCQANAAVTGGTANCLRIVRAVNADARLVQPHPENTYEIVRARR